MGTELVTADFRQVASVLRHVEKLRISANNRLCCLTTFPRNKDWGMHLPESHPDVFRMTSILKEIQGWEDDAIFQLTELFKASPLYPWTAQFKGLAPGKLVARLLAETGDPYLRNGEPRKFSQLKSLCGVSVVTDEKTGIAHAPRHVAGAQSRFRSAARVRLWLITDQLVKQHTFPFFETFQAGVDKYKDERYRGTDLKGKPWSDERFAVVGRKRARVLVHVAFLEGLYREARRLHTGEPAFPEPVNVTEP